MPLRVLVTGANGFIGRHVVAALLANGHSVFGISLEPTTSIESPGFCYRQLDITDHLAAATFLGSEPFDAVVHLAALVHVRDSRLTFGDYARVNFRASEALFKHAVAAGVRRIAFASTVEVYGPISRGECVDESRACRPESDYARTKLLAEDALRDASEAAGVAHASLRFGPVYGPEFRLNLDKRLYLRAPWIAYRLGAGDYRLHLCSVQNIGAWIARWLALPTPASGAFNLADSQARSVRDLLQLERDHGRARIVLPLPRLPCLAILAARELALSTLGRDTGILSTSNFRKLETSACWNTTRAESAVGPLPGDIARDIYSSPSSHSL